MLNLSSEDKGTWFYFDENNPDAGGVCLRELTPDESDRIERITVKVKKKFRRGIAYEDREEDTKLASKLRWDYVIVAWNKVSIDGHVVECTTDNKVKAMNIIEFVKIIVDKLDILTETNKALAKVKAKNSGSSSSDSSKSQTVKPA